jgi:hypothetical protein
MSSGFDPRLKWRATKKSNTTASSVQNSGIQKSSPTKRTTSSPAKRIARAYEANSTGSVYKFNFGKHSRRTIQEVVKRDPMGSLCYVEWCLGNQELLNNRPDLVDGLRALSNDCLNEHTSLREAMEKKGIYPADLSSSSIVKGENDDCRYFEATQWDTILSNNQGSEYQEEQLLEMLESSTAPMILTFTGTIIRTECHIADFGDTGLDAYTILPCGWSRDAALKSFFRSGEYELEQLEHMLYKTYSTRS